MTTSDRVRFHALMMGLGETFNEGISPVRLEAYFDALADLPIEAVMAGVQRVIATSRFFPRPIEIRDAAIGNVTQLAERGWAAVLHQIRRVGYMGVPTFEDSACLATIERVFGGWRQLCEQLPASGPVFDTMRGQFLEHYRHVADDERRWLAHASSGGALPPGREE